MSKVQVPTIALLEPQNGVTDAVWQSVLDFVCGVGAVAARSAAFKPRTFDGLAETLDRGFICLYCRWYQKTITNGQLKYICWKQIEKERLKWI